MSDTTVPEVKTVSESHVAKFLELNERKIKSSAIAQHIAIEYQEFVDFLSKTYGGKLDIHIFGTTPTVEEVKEPLKLDKTDG